MGAIIDKITEFIKEMLQGWVLDNLGTMFTDVNTKVGEIAGEVGQTPSAWNGSIFFHDPEPFRECHDTHSGAYHQRNLVL